MHLTPLIRFLRCNSGAAAIEFAVVANIFIALLLGLFAVGYTYVVRSDIENSITSAERYALIHDETDATLENIIRSKLATYKASNLSLSFSRASSGGVDYVKTQVSYTIDIGVDFVFGPVSISSSRVFPT